MMLHLYRLLLVHLFISSAFSVDFLFNSFNDNTNLTLVGDARVDSSVIKLTKASDGYSVGRAFFEFPIRMRNNSNYLLSFSTSFVFSILPPTGPSPGYGLAFVLCNSTSFGIGDDDTSYQYFGLFPNSTRRSIAPILAVEFDTGYTPGTNDPDGNHVGVNLNSIDTSEVQKAEYHDHDGDVVPIDMRNGENIRVWIDFDGSRGTAPEIKVTIAPASVSRPSKTLFNFYDNRIGQYISNEMFVGFSASKDTSGEAQRILAWSFTNKGFGSLPDINTTKLPSFTPHLPHSQPSYPVGVIFGIAVSSFAVIILILFGSYWFWRRKRKSEEEDNIEEWELEYWPHRFSFQELNEATNEFSKENLVGFGGFGKVYKGTLSNNTEVAVKCVNHDSKQGFREFMAEISSMGRLQHKNLVHMRGWCRKGSELMLVYDYMPNGSLSSWIFDKPNQLLGWEGRRRVLVHVAEGLNYLHHGWDQVVLHRDIKSSNILLDSELEGRLGDFGLAKLYQHGTGGQAPGTTGVVGTLGYMAPELVNMGATASSDVYSFGVTVLEVACGRRPIDLRWDEPLLVDWVRKLYAQGRLCEAADARIAGEYRVEDMETVLMLGLACCNADPLQRPMMKDVLGILTSAEGSAPVRSLLSELAHGSVGSGKALEMEMTLSGTGSNESPPPPKLCTSVYIPLRNSYGG